MIGSTIAIWSCSASACTPLLRSYQMGVVYFFRFTICLVRFYMCKIDKRLDSLTIRPPISDLLTGDSYLIFDWLIICTHKTSPLLDLAPHMRSDSTFGSNEPEDM